MLRIFRGQRHVADAAQPEQRDAAQPEQREQGGDAEVEHGETIESATPVTAEPGFLDRGRMRRRARFLRAARELAYRDLGGLVFDLHRFGQRNDEIVKAKLDTLERIDAELRVLEAALQERRPVTVLREAGVAACPRCAAIHGSGDRFCPTCGLSVDQAERPIASPNVAPTQLATPGLPAPPALAQPPIPQPNLPVPATPPAPAPAAPPAPVAAQAALPAAPVSGLASAKLTGAPTPTPPSAPASPLAPLPPGSAPPEGPEQTTHVIAPARGGRPSQTVAFDPLGSPDGRPGAPEDSQGDEGSR